MQQTKYRAQILLEPEQHNALAEVARRENRSISELMREIVDQWLSQQDDQRLWEQRMEVLERLGQIRESIQQEYGVYQGDLIEEARADRDEDIDRVWRGEA
jgi:hypothetical protein